MSTPVAQKHTIAEKVKSIFASKKPSADAAAAPAPRAKPTDFPVRQTRLEKQYEQKKKQYGAGWHMPPHLSK